MQPLDCKTSLDDGCEFIDDGAYGGLGYSPLGKQAFTIPIQILKPFVDPNQLSRVRGDDNALLRQSIAYIGIRTPLEFAYDNRGMMTLSEGHHRFWVAQELGLECVPIVCNKTRGKIRTWCQPFMLPEFVFLMEEFLTALDRGWSKGYSRST